MKYIDADRLRAEIERRKELLTPHKGQGVILCREIIKQFDSLLSFINTISQPIMKDDIIDEIRAEIERRFSEYNHDSSHHKNMTLEEAIIHCKEKACGDTQCALEHRQLAEWLQELQQYRKKGEKNMTQEEIIQSISDDKMMPFIQPEQLVQIVAFVINNYRPSLPSNIDEAAEEYCTKCRENGYHLSPYSAFKVGAKWMAEQGETQEHFVIGTIADSPCGPAIVCYTNEFEIGDKVIIQIRKKD